MKISAILIVAIAFGATAPVLAASPDDGQKITLRYDAKRDRYCASQMITGSRMPQMDCRSRQDWAKAGLVIPDTNSAKLASK